MKMIFITIVLDGMPWTSFHYPTFRQLSFDWEWRVSEGVANNWHCTDWCNRLAPRLSQDGTSQYLRSIAALDSRVIIKQREFWERGKCHMLNEHMHEVQDENYLLMQVDSDEVWTVNQLEKIYQMFRERPEKDSAQFTGRCFWGPDIVSYDYNTGKDDWVRCWRGKRGNTFKCHEPPWLDSVGHWLPPNRFTQGETSLEGLVFDHFHMCHEQQALLKQQYYGRITGWYLNAVEQWKRLQANTVWPVKLRDYFPWVHAPYEAVRLIK